MKVLKVLVVLMLFSSLSYAGVYKWKDANGNWCFGDRLPDGAAEAENIGEVKRSLTIIDKPDMENKDSDSEPDLIEAFELKEATIVQEIKRDYISFTLRPMWINNNESKVSVY